MKTSLQLNLGQQLTLTPQLQQAIRLLQLSTLALQQEIQQTLEANPMLEMEENREAPTAANDATLPEKLTHTDTALQNESIPKELPVDTAWDDIYPTNFSKQNYNKDTQVNLENTISCQAGLQEYLTWQMQLTPFSTIDRLIATAIIDAIDDNGFLSSSLEDIQASLASDAEEPVGLDEITAVLHRIQHFDPISTGARDLSECLLIQLQQLPTNTPMINEAKLIVSKYMQLLGQRNYKQLLRQSKLSQAQLEATLQLIKSLNPRPGAALAANNAEYIAPDVRVTKHNNRWVVELNTEAIPKLRINNSYAGLIQRANQSNDNNFLRNNLQEARWFIKSLQSRNETLLKVATCIVEQQKGFLEYGEEAMKPLILHDIAQALDMHESTISRVTTQKYMHTPRGIFELKYFFSSHVSTNSGGECSATAIRALIKKLVAAENPHKPLSDNKIAQLLKEQGINIARRTIAKYREAMSIPPSNERKSLCS